jgi:hypothetical protein
MGLSVAALAGRSTVVRFDYSTTTTPFIPDDLCGAQ